MRDFSNLPGDLGGSLLVAHPSLLDPNFRRSVLVLSANDAKDGSLGFIINRPTGKYVGDLVPGNLELQNLARVPVFLGGPVANDRLTFVAMHWDHAKGTIECRAHVAPEEAETLTNEARITVRAFAGYAGWSAGQLESELKQNAWVIRKPDPQMLEAAGSADLWPSIMRRMGPWFRLLASAPEDPSLN